MGVINVLYSHKVDVYDTLLAWEIFLGTPEYQRTSKMLRFSTMP
jgi:hypothetical protein